MKPSMAQGGMPRPGKAITGLMIANVVLYIAEVIAFRAGLRVDEWLFLTPQRVFQDGWLWQPLTYVFFHSPSSAGHLLMNMLMLWMFGSALEQSWGPRRVLVAYAVCALSGAALTLIVALASQLPVMTSILPGFYERAHVGASGATLGLTIAWAVVFAKERMSFPFLGQMTGRTFALVIIAIEVLVALSLDGTSSTSHFGGMIGGFVLVKGLWKPSGWRGLFRRSSLEIQRRKLEHDLRVIEGGKGKDDLPN